jgi:hypothetical protein
MLTVNANGKKGATLSLDEMVTRDYRVGIRFEGNSIAKRRSSELFATAIVNSYQQELYRKITPERVAIVEQTLLERPGLSGTMGVGVLRPLLGDCSNLGEAAYLPLLQAVKGMFMRQEKMALFFQIAGEQPRNILEWYIFGRSPFAESCLQKRLNLSHGYVSAMVLGARRNLDGHLAVDQLLTAPLPRLTVKELAKAVKDFQQEIKVSMDQQLLEKDLHELTNYQKAFQRKLKRLAEQREAIACLFIEWLAEQAQPLETTPKSRWSHFNAFCRAISAFMVEQGYPRTADYAYRSALRGILITALLPLYGNGRFVQQMMVKGMISVEKVISKPFSKKKPSHEQKLPLKLVMGSKYVVGRPGGGEVLTRLAREQGYFDLAFWPYRRKKQAVTGKVRLHGKLQEYLERGAEITSLTVTAGDAPARKLTVNITFKGRMKYFLSATDIQNQAKIIYNKKKHKSVKSVGLDINRLSKYMLAYSGQEGLSNELLKAVNRYLNLEKPISELHVGLDRKRKAFLAYPSKERHVAWLKVKGELDRVYNRRRNLLADLHRKSSRFTAAVLLTNGSHVLCVEDLNVTAKGTKGALAKAVLSMPDGSGLYERSCLLVEWLTGETTTLVKVDPRGTSQCQHHGCPSVPAGKVLRDSTNRDEAPCSSCLTRVNVHDNSAVEINGRGLALLASPS